jgi:hypothetical protein
VAYEAQFGRTRNENEDETLHAFRLRFIRAAKSVVLAHELEQTGEAALVARFAKLRAAEAQNPLRSGVGAPRLSAAEAAARIAGG